MRKNRIDKADGMVFPNQHQRLLLEACLHSGDNGEAYYHQWRSQLSGGKMGGDQEFSILFDKLDEGSQRLLPYLYYKYVAQIDDSFIQNIKGYYQQGWGKNQILWHEFKVLAKELNQHGITPLLTKGMALTHLYFKDMGARPMNDVDIVVPPGKVDLSLKVIQDLGWIDVRTGQRVFTAEGSLLDARTFINKKNFQMDFHWRVLKEQLNTDWIETNWKNATHMNKEGVNFMALDPVDQLIHTLVHGITWNKVPSFRWVLDAQKSIEDPKFNWDYLYDQSNRWKCNPFVFEGLKYLSQLKTIDVDEHTLEKLLPITSNQKSYFEIKQKKILNGNLRYVRLILMQLKLYFPGNRMRGILSWIRSFIRNHKNSNRSLFVLIRFFILKSIGLKNETPYQDAIKKIKSGAE